MSSKFCHRFGKDVFLWWRQTTYIISVWKTLHAAQQAPIINQLWKSIYGRSATNKSMAGEILQLLPSPGPRITKPPPPSNVDLEKLDICSNMVATWQVQTCSESFLPQPRSLVFWGHMWKQNSFVPHEYLILLKTQDEHLRALFPLPSQA